MSKTSTVEVPTQQETKSRGGINARVVFHAVQRHPLAILSVIFLAVASAAGVWFFLPLHKKSAAIVFHIDSQPQALLAPTLESRIDFAAYRLAQMALLKSRRTLNAVLKEPDVRNLQMIRMAQPDLLGWLEKSISVDSRSSSGGINYSGEFMRVTIDGDNEDELLALLNAVAKAYQAATYERDNGARLHRQDELEKTFVKAKDELKRYQIKIDEIAVALGSKDGPTLATYDTFQRDSLRLAVQVHASLLDELELVTGQLSAAKSISRRPAILAVVGTACVVTFPQQVIPRAMIEDEVRGDVVFRELELAVTHSSKVLKDTEALFQPGTTQLLRAQADLKAAEEKRDHHYKEARTKAETLLMEKLAQNEEARANLMQAEYDRIKARIDRASLKVQELQREISKLSTYKIDLENLRSDISQKEKYTLQLADEIERIKIEGKVPPRVTVSEEPFIVAGIEGNRRLRYTLLTGIGVLLVGFGGIIGWESRSRRVTHADEVSTALGTRLIGTIPPFNAKERDASHSDLHAVFVEAIDSTRTMLMHGTPNGTKLRVLIVSSALSGEGKTTLAGHLAISLTRAGFRTLLVDGDMHAPSAHKLFDLPASPGLSELLCGDIDLNRAVRPSPISGLSVLPAGKWTMATRQMLVRNRWQPLKKEMESQYDFVVIDSSPLLLVTDTLLLAREADGVILSVLLGVSQIAGIAESMNRLQTVGATLAGVVVNNVRCDVYHHKFSYRSKYPASPTPKALTSMAQDTDGSKTQNLADVSERSRVSNDGALPYAEEYSEEV